ncbi:hypothetical protein [Roseibium sp. Sym1]|uniref:hypothetical protein n=1 Tax=Roseibium sp. Sym1 TaxID=3016006 RepID=UPI0022B5A037|nr:hypothetical protein [Roseibium sp. Sym1]
MKKVFLCIISWLGQNWEPITAITALFVGFFSSFLAYYTYLLQEESAFLSRTPLLSFSMDADANSISLTNTGLGSANIYSFHIWHKDNYWSFKSGEGIQKSDTIIQQSLSDAIKSIDNKTYEKLIGKVIKLGPVVGFLEPDGHQLIFEIPKEYLNTDELDLIFRLQTSLHMVACYSDLYGEISGSASNISSEHAASAKCEIPPKIIKRR